MYGTDPAFFQGSQLAGGPVEGGYVIEAALAWDLLLRGMPALKSSVEAGYKFNMTLICPDPDGGDGYGQTFWGRSYGDFLMDRDWWPDFILGPLGAEGATITVNSTDDPGTSGDDYVTLREAMNFAAGRASPSGGEIAQVTGTPASVFPDTIRFDTSVFPPGAPATILVVDERLPAMDRGNDVIDGSDAGVVVDGSSISGGATGFVIVSDSNAIKGLQVLYFPLYGVLIHDGAQNNILGGDTESEGNIISGHQNGGVVIDGSGTSGNVVQGNFIGTDATGTKRVPNGEWGVFVAQGATDNIIGGSSPNEGNLISGNDYAGIEIHGTGTAGNIVQGNYYSLTL